MPDPATLAREVLDRVREMGFALGGVCAARASDRADELIAWLDAGKHATMSYLRDDVAERLDPERLLPGVRSVIVVADLYLSRNAGRDAPLAPGSARIARYARGDDYHRTIKKRLHALSDALRAEHPGHRFKSFVDIEPVLEREHAERAGLGWIGKHTLLIHPRIGSWFVLGGVMTSLELTPPPEQRPVPDACGTCTRCIDACPTGAISPYSVDAGRCISYLTIERRPPIPEEFHEPIGEWLFGCDICQEVCPHNSPRPGDAGPDPNPAYAPRRDSFDLLEVLGWTQEDKIAAFYRSALKRARLDLFKRNALIASGNILRTTDLPALRARVEEVAADTGEPEIVRSTARTVLERLRRGRAT